MPGTAASIFDAEVLRQCQVQRFLAGFSDFLSKMVNIEVICQMHFENTRIDMEHHGNLSLNLSWAMFSMFNCGMGHQLQIEMDLFCTVFVWYYFVATAIQQSEDRSINAVTLILELCEAASSRYLKAYPMGIYSSAHSSLTNNVFGAPSPDFFL